MPLMDAMRPGHMPAENHTPRITGALDDCWRVGYPDLAGGGWWSDVMNAGMVKRKHWDRHISIQVDNTHQCSRLWCFRQNGAAWMRDRSELGRKMAAKPLIIGG
jgi:hypothetical protein